MANSLVTRRLYKSLLTLARRFDVQPALKTLIGPQTFDYGYGLWRFVLPGRRLFYVPTGTALADVVRFAFRDPTSFLRAADPLGGAEHPEPQRDVELAMDAAFAAVRFFHGRVEIARDVGLISADDSFAPSVIPGLPTLPPPSPRVQWKADPEPGNFLMAHPALNDPNFYRRVVLILEYDRHKGCVGVVVNPVQCVATLPPVARIRTKVPGRWSAQLREAAKAEDTMAMLEEQGPELQKWLETDSIHNLRNLYSKRDLRRWERVGVLIRDVMQAKWDMQQNLRKRCEGNGASVATAEAAVAPSSSSSSSSPVSPSSDPVEQRRMSISEAIVAGAAGRPVGGTLASVLPSQQHADSESEWAWAGGETGASAATILGNAVPVLVGGPVPCLPTCIHTVDSIGGVRVGLVPKEIHPADPSATQTEDVQRQPLYLGAIPSMLREAMRKGTIQANDVVFFGSVSSWAPGQLERELEEGSWVCAEHRDPWSLVQEASGHATSAMDPELSEWESRSVQAGTPRTGVRLLGSSLWSFLWESLGGEFAGMSRVPSYRKLEQRSRQGGSAAGSSESDAGDESPGSADGPVGAAEPVWSQWSGVSDHGEDETDHADSDAEEAPSGDESGDDNDDDDGKNGHRR